MEKVGGCRAKEGRRNGWKNCSAAMEYIAQGYVICTYCLFILNLFGSFFFLWFSLLLRYENTKVNITKKKRAYSGTATIHRTEAKPRKRGNEETKKNNKKKYEHAWNERAIRVKIVFVLITKREKKNKNINK